MCPVRSISSGQKARTATMCRESGRLGQVAEMLRRMPALLIPFLLAACMSPGAPHGSPGEGAPPRRSPCILAIENQNWHDLHLYAVTESGERVRLATLGSLEARRIPIPQTLMLGQRIRLMAVPPLSRETMMTEFVMPDDGRTFHWTLRNHLALSTLVVR